MQPIGQRQVYGAEFLVRQHLAAGFFGWVAWTILRGERRFVDEEQPSGFSKWRLSGIDQTHIVSIAASYQLPWWELEFGAALRYVTGAPTTYAAGGVFDADEGEYDRVNGPVNSQRLPDFFQLDLRVDKRFTFDTWALALFLDLQNATNQQNYEFFTYSYDYSVVAGFPGLPILPVFGLEASF